MIKGIYKDTIQPKLTIGQPNDVYEQEADAVANQVMKMSAHQDTSIQRKCDQCEEEELQMKPLSDSISPIVQKQSNGGMASSTISKSLAKSKGSGQKMDNTTKSFMNKGIGADFSNVKIHTDSRAIQMNQSLGAKAFTNGNDVYFNKGQYNPKSSDGKHLLAHELTHVVQQGAHIGSPNVNNKIQRDTLEGKDDKCYAQARRDIRRGDSSSRLPTTSSPGGTIIPDTEGTSQNCAGVSLCNRTEWVNWPNLGREASDGRSYGPGFNGNWNRARYFIPTGCTYVSSRGVGVNSTYCSSSEREIIVFLYRWPIGRVRGTNVTVFQSDFHMIGRDCSSLPQAWESKMDRRERVTNIQDPLQSLHDAYPHTLNPNREIVRLTFCCDCDMVATS
ncbi:DUF4157 domain-containing protein [uncultured Aquimarina sp.]|uniref:eCIS core domain-containing protein n=1 Tax=uncultured Aquimarina sp. TaxID=575652 RepID=UPI00261C2016|nr:DUF4157 domain-containing protein [uncultured Aquimarina sp.]